MGTLTETPTASESATPENSLTPSETPTASETATLENSATPTETLTETPTPLPPAPPMSLLFGDNFDSGPLPIWTFGAGWTVVPSENGQALQVTNSDEPTASETAQTTLVYDNLWNLAADARFQINAGAAKLTLRQSAAGDYSATLDASGQVSLWRGGAVIASAAVSPSTPGQWRTLRLSVIEGVLRVAVDAVEVMALLDDAPLPPGKMAFAGVGVGESVLLVDDVEVWLPSSDVTPSPTPTETATPSETPTETPTPLPPEPELTLLVSEQFNGGRNPFEQLTGPRWRLARHTSVNDLALRLTGSQPTQILPLAAYDGAAVQVAVLLSSGAIRLNVQESDAGVYSATLDASGQVKLYRNDTLMSLVMAGSPSADSWRTFRLSAVGGIVRVDVDGVELIALADDSPLPSGLAGFVGEDLPANGILVDDIFFWGSIAEQTSSRPALAVAPSTPTVGAYQFTPEDYLVFTGAQPAANTVFGIYSLSLANPTSPLHLPVPDNVIDTEDETFTFDQSNVPNNPVLSPDGRRVAFDCSIANVIAYGICLEMDGVFYPLNLLPGAADGFVMYDYDVGGWSPDSQWLVYTGLTNDPYEVWAVHLSTPEEIANPTPVPVLTASPYNAYYAWDTTWGQDGQIYVSLYASGGGGRNNPSTDGIYQIAFDTQTGQPGSVTPMTSAADDGIDDAYQRTQAPHRKPDVNRDGVIAFQTFDTLVAYNPNHVMIYDPRQPAGQRYSPIDTSPYASGPTAPEWQPAGQISFSAYVFDTGGIGLVVVNTDGSNPQQVNVDSGYEIDSGEDWLAPPDSNCTNNTVDVVRLYPGITIEAQDMRAIASEANLYLHEGPAINARQIGVLYWGQNVRVIGRVTFPQSAADGTQAPSQVWYELGDGNSPPQPLGWIVARMEDKYYVAGVTASNDPCSQLGPPATLTFTYNREAAAQYAMANAYRNSVLTSTPYPDNVNRVTSALANNNPPIPVNGGGTLANPFATLIPYAYFAYPQQVIGDQPGFTGSAVFNSEAIWMGGLPMTYDYQSTDTSCPTEGNAGTSGWRYCAPDAVRASYAWRAHNALVPYYSSSNNLVINSDAGQITSGNDKFVDLPDGRLTQRFNQIAGRMIDGAPELINATNQQTFYDTYINQSNPTPYTFVGIDAVQTGDYLWINRGIPVFEHGFFVVGWGDITSCPDALGRVWTYQPVSDPASNPPIEGQLFENFQSGALRVPYVVDFNGSIGNGQLQRPRPRPFYCIQAVDAVDGDRFRLDDSYVFYAFPRDPITISPAQLYVPLNWPQGN